MTWNLSATRVAFGSPSRTPLAKEADRSIVTCVIAARHGAGWASNHADTTAAERPSTCARGPPVPADLPSVSRTDPPDPDRRRQRLPMDSGVARSRPDRGASRRDHRLTGPRSLVHGARTRRDPGTPHGRGPCRPARDAVIALR